MRSGRAADWGRMKTTCVLLALLLLALGAALPAAAGASPTSPIAHSRGLIRLGSAEGESGEEGEATEEEGEEESEEAEEEEGTGSSQRHRDARHAHSAARLTSLALTHGVRQALRHGHLRASGVCFSFTLSETSKVQATLEARSHAAGRTSWRAVSHLTLSGKRGSNLARFDGRTTLAAGYDRLTLALAHGSPRTVEFRVR